MQSMGLADLYYVAYQSAAQLHNAAHQMPYVLQIASVKRHRPIHTGRMEIRFALVRPELMFGIETKQYQGMQLRVSDRERTALDLVDRPELRGGMEEATITLRQLLDDADPERLADYAVKLGNKSIIQRLGFLLDTIKPIGSNKAFELLHNHRGRIVVPLEPGGSPNGEANRV